MDRNFTLSNRRYLGNKTKLLPYIIDIVNSKCNDIKSVADIFAGTGCVANAFADKILYTNDILKSNFITHYAWFSPEDFDKKKIIYLIDEFNSYKKINNNYMRKNFSNTYFNDFVCSKIGYIRENIETMFKKQEINKREKALLVTSLLYAMDKIAATCGHYDAYRKNAKFADDIELLVPLAPENNNIQNKCFNIDANELVKTLKADLVYLDPPYNSRQYSDNYHLLENVATWKKPKVFGVARKMDRTGLKSNYCGNNAEASFINLINNINAKYILFSYNNTGNKANERSNAKISDNIIIKTLSDKGKLDIFEQNYKTFNAGKSNIQNNIERLFLCHCL